MERDRPPQATASKTEKQQQQQQQQQEQQHRGEEASAAHDDLSFPQFMVAGSIAGMVEHIAMFPIDTLKTRTQMMTGGYGSAQISSSVPKVLSAIIRSEGVLGLYRGVGAMALGAGPAHAVYFSVYEFFKERMGGNKPGHHPLSHAMAGILATIGSDAVFTPMDVVKQRLQLPGSSYRGIMDCIGKILRDEGIKAFYASYRTTVVMNAPYTATHFATYEAAKGALKNVWPDKVGEERIFVHLTAGGAAGALASIVTTPLDVVKTRLQCQVSLDMFTYTHLCTPLNIC
jgi:solute carrier family 25 iron transporter 28/37